MKMITGNSNDCNAKFTVTRACLALAVICFMSLSAAPQIQAQVKQDRKLAQAGGHTFIPTLRIQDPFVTTYVRNATGFGVAIDLIVPIYDEDGNEAGTFQGDLGFFLLEFEYQQAVNNWLAFWGQVSGLGRVGINAESVLAQGISAVAGFELGGKARLWHNREATLSLVGGARRSRLFGVDIIGFAQTVIDSGGIVDESSLLNEVNTTRWKGGLRFAYGVSRFFGFTLIGDVVAAGSLVEGEGREAAYTFGGSLGFDFDALSPLAIGVLLGYTQSSFSEGGDDIIDKARGWNLKIVYTGREEFSVGLEFVVQNASQRQVDRDLNSASGFFTLRYFF